MRFAKSRRSLRLALGETSRSAVQGAPASAGERTSVFSGQRVERGDSGAGLERILQLARLGSQRGVRPAAFVASSALLRRRVLRFGFSEARAQESHDIRRKLALILQSSVLFKSEQGLKLSFAGLDIAFRITSCVSSERRRKGMSSFFPPRLSLRLLRPLSATFAFFAELG